MTADNSIRYGAEHSLMTANLKLARNEVLPDELQQMMRIRREADFYDISPEITMKALEITNANGWVIQSYPMPPSHCGYIRISMADDTPLGGNDHPVRFNGMLWEGMSFYLVHDDGAQDRIAFATVKATLGGSFAEHKEKWRRGEYVMADFRGREDDANVPPWRNVTVRYIAANPANGDINIIRKPLEEMLAMVHVIFDMIAETKATTIERRTERNHFGSKQRDYFERISVVKISLGRAKKKYLREFHESTGRTNAWHEVRAHFRHVRVTKPDCQHKWVHRYAEDDGKHYKCEHCGEWKTRVVFPNGAGDRSKGRVKHVYEVTR